jgi:formate hydrogenlyase subunit 6/NADH:ubiquinone oxidoreductase subunit I
MRGIQMYLPKLREVKEALSSLFSAPYTTKYPADPYTAPTEYRGKPRYNIEECVGCGTCAQVCPATAIEVIEDISRMMRTLRVNYCSCINCGQCEEKCITEKGIKCTNEYVLSVTSTKAPEVYETCEKELAVCEICGEIIACKDHLLWIKERLGAKAYSNPNLLMAAEGLFFNFERYSAKGRVRREDYIKEVCPKCRQKITVADEN